MSIFEADGTLHTEKRESADSALSYIKRKGAIGKIWKCAQRGEKSMDTELDILFIIFSSAIWAFFGMFIGAMVDEYRGGKGLWIGTLIGSIIGFVISIMFQNI